MLRRVPAYLRALLSGGLVLLVLMQLVVRAIPGDVEAQQAPFTCTQIVGFSQTMQWYFAGFQSAVGNPHNWELRWVGGGSIGNWADPNYSGWQDQNQVDGCSQSSSAPDRGLLNISGDFNNDPNYWAQQTQAAMNNLRAKYPTIQQIILQSVVGGPGGGLCYFNGNVVRASYNFPYINQAIQRLAGGSVVAGIAPTVNSCADYADDIGHLTDQAKGTVGITIGSYYASGGTSSSTPTPTPTPTTAPTMAATATPTSTPPATPTVSAGGTQTITFDDLGSPNRPLNGQYPTGVIDWGTRSWYLSGPYGAFRSNSVGFNGSGPTSETFTFSSPKRLLQVDAYNGGSTATDIALSCDGVVASQSTVNSQQMRTIAMGSIGVCNTVTFASSNGWNTNFDNLVIDSGGLSSTPTSTPVATDTPVPTNTPTQVATNTPVPTTTPTRVATKTPGPTTTPTRVATNTPVPTSTPTRVATNTPTPLPATHGSVTVTFDDLANPNRPLNGQYPSGVIDWGTNNWYLAGPTGGATSNSVRFNGGASSATLSLVSPRRLASVDVYNAGSLPTVVTLSCAGQTSVVFPVLPNQTTTIQTNWTGACASVTLSTSNGPQVFFDNFFLP